MCQPGPRLIDVNLKHNIFRLVNMLCVVYNPIVNRPSSSRADRSTHGVHGGIVKTCLAIAGPSLDFHGAESRLTQIKDDDRFRVKRIVIISRLLPNHGIGVG